MARSSRRRCPSGRMRASVEAHRDRDYSAPDHRCTAAVRFAASMMPSRSLAVSSRWSGCGSCWPRAAPCRRASDARRRAGAAAPAAAPAPAAPAPAPPPPAAFADVVARAGEQLLREAQAVVGSGPRELVIDPLIDASTGQQTAGTVQMGQQLAALIKSRVPHWSVRPLTRDQPGEPAAAPDRHAHGDQHQGRARRERRRVPHLPGADRPAHRQARRQAGRPRHARDGRRPSRRRSSATARPGRSTATAARLHQVVPGQLARRQRRSGVPAAPAGGGDRRRGAGGVRREQAGRGLSPVPRGPAASPTPTTCASSTASTSPAGAPARRRKRPRPSAGSSASASTARSCRSRSSSTPARRRCSPRPTCRRSTRSGCARWRSRSACARPA